MRIIDANLIIYFANSGFEWLNNHIQTSDSFYAEATKIEVLGYHKITPSAKAFFQIYFDSINALPLTSEIVEVAIQLRQIKKNDIG